MSLALIDLAYIGCKATVSLVYYIAKGGYHGYHYLRSTPSQQLETEHQTLLREIRQLREEIVEIKNKGLLLKENDDQYLEIIHKNQFL